MQMKEPTLFSKGDKSRRKEWQLPRKRKLQPKLLLKLRQRKKPWKRREDSKRKRRREKHKLLKINQMTREQRWHRQGHTLWSV